MSLKLKNDTSKLFEREPTLRYSGGGMPLIKGKSEKSFVKNLKTEMEHGHPQKQSLAIAYAMKRKAEKRKKMAEGGEASDAPNLPGADEAQQSMRKAFKYAKGGFIGSHQPSGKPETHPDYYEPESHLEGEMDTGYLDMPMEHEKHNMMAMSEDNKKLGQHGVHEQGPVPCEYKDEEDIVDRIMEQRSKDFSSEARFSEGGKVANQDKEITSDMPNEFDVLHLEDGLESTYGDDDNSGDALGNAQEDQDRKDIVARIIASRRLKSRMPPGYPGR